MWIANKPKRIKVITVNCILILLTLLSAFGGCTSQTNNVTNSSPQKNGYVSDENTAIKIAEAIWLPIYGEEIYKEKPFHAKLQGDSIWIVEGTLHDELGGVACAEIQRKDGKILKVIHGK